MEEEVLGVISVSPTIVTQKSPIPEQDDLMIESLATRDESEEIRVSDEESYKAAAEFLKEIKSREKAVTSFFKPLKDAAHKTHKTITEMEKKTLAPLKEAEGLVKEKVTSYLDEKEKAYREAERLARERAELEAKRLADEAEKMMESGNEEVAESMRSAANAMESTARSVGVTFTPEKVKGVSNSKTWAIKSIDPEKVPIMFGDICIRPVDSSAVLKMIKESKGTIQIPGVEYEEKTIVSVRG